MAKIIPLNDPENPFDAGPAWHRSFPPQSVAGNQWMLSVLDDLISFSQDKNLCEVANELRVTRYRIAPRLPAE
jgi:hypothetical protein